VSLIVGFLNGSKVKVPVRYVEFKDELEEREAVIEFNRRREKTPGQLVNEFEEMLEIERQRAEERKRSREKDLAKVPEMFPGPLRAEKPATKPPRSSTPMCRAGR
jgi:hypothetical protein